MAPLPAPSHLLYLHGFRSSPSSAKAMRVMRWLSEHRAEVTAWCPQLPPSPAQAMAEVGERLAEWRRSLPTGEPGFADRLVVIGSSLGGFYATHVAEQTGCRAVLLNPAVDPARDLARHIGEQKAWHSDERFFFEPRFVEELRALTHPRCTRPQRVMAVIATGDEVLDWQEMRDRYAGCVLRIVEGSDHALSDFDDHLDTVLAFCGLTS